MIIDDDRAEETLRGMTYEGDEYTHHHIQDTSLIQQSCYEQRQDDSNGWTKDRGFRKIGEIPPLDAVKIQAERPGIFGSEEMMKEWLKKEGERYLTVKRNSI